jgi:7-keto-8-aminopelargonate synthetase-like enzyme
MRHAAIAAATAVTLTIALSGCQSHQAKVDALQKKYDQLSQQFGKDCSAEYLKVPPILSPKCNDENQRMKEVWDQLQAERAKK